MWFGVSDNLLTGPLEDRHRELGATFAEFGGWLMPVSYGGTVGEHNATRNAVGLFDVSHLGKALVLGPGAAEYVNSALTNDLRRIGPGKAQYTLCCNDSGGVIDDLIAYYVSDDEVFLVPNAANTAAVVAALQAKAPAGLTITDEHRSYAVLAVQGPKSAEVLDALGLPTDMDYMGYADAEFGGVPRAGAAVPATPANTAMNCFPIGTAPRSCSTRWSRRSRRRVVNPPDSAPATPCAPRWATRCTGTSCPWTSPRCRLDAAGRSAGRRTRSGAARHCSQRSRPGRDVCSAGSRRWAAGCCGPT